MQQTLRFAVRSRSLPCCFWGEFGPRAARRQSEILIERKLSETIYSTKKVTYILKHFLFSLKKKYKQPTNQNTIDSIVCKSIKKKIKKKKEKTSVFKVFKTSRKNAKNCCKRARIAEKSFGNLKTVRQINNTPQLSKNTARSSKLIYAPSLFPGHL